MKIVATQIGMTLRKLSLVRLFAALLATVLLITAAGSANAADLSPGLQEKLDEIVAEGETGRPRTARQWEAEAEELRGKPVERFKRAVEESIDAAGELIEIYPENIETLTSDINAETAAEPENKG